MRRKRQKKQSPPFEPIPLHIELHIERPKPLPLPPEEEAPKTPRVIIIDLA